MDEKLNNEAVDNFAARVVKFPGRHQLFRESFERVVPEIGVFYKSSEVVAGAVSALYEGDGTSIYRGAVPECEDPWCSHHE